MTTVENKVLKFLIFKMAPGAFNKFKFLVANRYIIKGQFVRVGPPRSDDEALVDVYTLPIESIVERLSVVDEKIPDVSAVETVGDRISNDNYVTIIVRITDCRPNNSGVRFTVDTTSGEFPMPLWFKDFKNNLTYFTPDQSFMMFNLKVGRYNDDIQLQYSPVSCAVRL